MFTSASFIYDPNLTKEKKLIAEKPVSFLGDPDFSRNSLVGAKVNSRNVIETGVKNLFTFSEQFNNIAWNKARCNMVPDVEIAPNGTRTADLLQATATGGAYFWTTHNFITSTEYTMSIYAKAVEIDTVTIQSFTQFGHAQFLLVGNGSIVGRSGIVVKASITSEGNGWYRCSATMIATSTAANNIGYGVENPLGNHAYYWGAQFEVGDKATSYYPTTDRLNIPKLDYSTEIPQPIVSNPTRNLLRDSERFLPDFFAYPTVSKSATTVLSPIGTPTAMAFTVLSTSQPRIEHASPVVAAGVQYTLSVHVKKSIGTYFALSRFNGISDVYSIFNLDTGTVHFSTPGATGNIQTLTNGWYRISLSITSISSETLNYFKMVGSSTEFAIGISGNVFILWGAQLELSSAPTDYQPQPAYLTEYSSSICPALLVEPQKTNLCIRSEDFSNASWIKRGTPVVSTGHQAPNGTFTATLLDIAGHSVRDIFLPVNNVGPVSQNTRFENSIYIKRLSTSGSFLLVEPQGTGGSTGYILVEMSRLPDNWVRISKDSPFISAYTPYRTSNAGNGGLFMYSNSSAQFYAWGAQSELGEQVTTYIPTTTTTVTRPVDDFTLNSVFDKKLISPYGGTWYAELINNQVLTRDDINGGLCLDTSPLGLQNGFGIRGGNNTRLELIKSLNNNTEVLHITDSPIVKVVFRWNRTTADVFYNGVKIITDTPFDYTRMQALSTASPNDVPKYIKRLALWNTVRTDQECIDATAVTYLDKYKAEGGATIENTASVDAALIALNNIP